MSMECDECGADVIGKRQVMAFAEQYTYDCHNCPNKWTTRSWS